ncbi:hypothetical protein BU15DRAFT_79534 [Melanogaster broomeanus]|nr:hypothetical protein BU15DRAFT_79534 [Melanogaster broomeanus]
MPHLIRTIPKWVLDESRGGMREWGRTLEANVMNMLSLKIGLRLEKRFDRFELNPIILHANKCLPCRIYQLLLSQPAGVELDVCQDARVDSDIEDDDDTAHAKAKERRPRKSRRNAEDEDDVSGKEEEKCRQEEEQQRRREEAERPRREEEAELRKERTEQRECKENAEEGH